MHRRGMRAPLRTSDRTRMKECWSLRRHRDELSCVVISGPRHITQQRVSISFFLAGLHQMEEDLFLYGVFPCNHLARYPSSEHQ